jgi:hypothetical protein
MRSVKKVNFFLFQSKALAKTKILTGFPRFRKKITENVCVKYRSGYIVINREVAAATLSLLYMKSEFEQLIEKYQKGLLSDQEKELLDAWFDSLGHDAAHAVRKEAERKVLKQRVMAGLVSSDVRKPAVARTRTLSSVRIWGIAASVLLLAVASFAIRQYVWWGDESIPQELTAASVE